MPMRKEHGPLIVAVLSLGALPFVLDVVGLPLRSAVDVVAFAIACMGLNILVGYTGLVSFGHGAWFGLGAYAAALSQRYWFPGDIMLPTLFSALFVAASAVLSGALILRRRGVYFSLLTLALTALLFAISYRWTELTGGESGLGGVTRSRVLGIDLEYDRTYYGLVAVVGLAVCYLLWRFHHSPVGSVLVAIRENEQRARFVGYPTNRYKLIGFVLSAVVVALAGHCPSSITVSHRPSRLQSPSRASSSPWWSLAGCEVSWALRLAPCSSSCSASFCRSGRRTGCSISACCSSASSCSHRPAWSASPSG